MQVRCYVLMVTQTASDRAMDPARPWGPGTYPNQNTAQEAKSHTVFIFGQVGWSNRTVSLQAWIISIQEIISWQIRIYFLIKIIFLILISWKMKFTPARTHTHTHKWLKGQDIDIMLSFYVWENLFHNWSSINKELRHSYPGTQDTAHGCSSRNWPINL